MSWPTVPVPLANLGKDDIPGQLPLFPITDGMRAEHARNCADSLCICKDGPCTGDDCWCAGQ